MNVQCDAHCFVHFVAWSPGIFYTPVSCTDGNANLRRKLLDLLQLLVSTRQMHANNIFSFEVVWGITAPVSAKFGGTISLLNARGQFPDGSTSGASFFRRTFESNKKLNRD